LAATESALTQDGRARPERCDDPTPLALSGEV
jgi:hypothetical protein